MSQSPPKAVPAKSWKPAAIGILWGLIAALAWSGYNAGSRLGRMDGLGPMEMSMLRFGVAAVLLTPLMLLRPSEKRLGWARLISLTILAGPLFGLLINTAFGLAPLSHAVVLTAGATMVSANALAWTIDRHRPPALRLLGMAILIGGLMVIASDQFNHEPRSASHIWLGDLCFIAAGALWGTFTYLLGRWKVEPVVGIGQVSILSTLAFLPFYLASSPDTGMPSSVWIGQAFFQGILGGCLAPVAIAKAVSRLGSGEAALFPALVPSGALVVAIPLLGEWPSALEVLGVAICTLGLVTAFVVGRLFSVSASSLRRRDG